ncbi:hypothetical protein ACNKHT_10135 [Shigella flexneri]
MVLLCAGLGCWLCPLIRRREPRVPDLFWANPHTWRWDHQGVCSFYGLHMTVGMAIAG